MATLPRLTEANIRGWTGDTSFERGRPYARDGSIFNPRRQGLTLKAQCHGSLPQPYHVTATLGEQGIVTANCSCPVGGGGRCKHVAALLLTWLAEPDAFVETEVLEAALERRDKAELIALIRQMTARYPDLELMLELPVPGAKKGQQPPVSQETIRRQARNAFAAGGDEWGAAYGIAQDLERLVQVGDGYAQAQDWRSAAASYTTVAREVLDHYEEVDDENGDLVEVVNNCVSGLGECLDAAGDPAEREALLRALFDVYRWDVEFGGIDMGYEATDIILAHATPEERARVAAWVRDAMPSAGGSWSDGYHRERYGGLLLALAGEGLDDETFLRICRETGRTRDLAARLLKLGRLDEALDVSRQAPPGLLLNFADLLREHDHAGPAERLVRERAIVGQDHQATEWLKTRAIERGDLAEAQALTEAQFWRNPTLAGYDQVKQLAQERGRWDALRPELLARLAKEGKYGPLTEIHLREGEVDQALKTLPHVGGWVAYGDAPLSIRVARAAEERRPGEAIRIYTGVAKRLIEAQGRDNYAAAARYLARVRDLHQRLGEPKTWLALIADIRQQNKRLRALQEELTKAGL